VLTAQSTIHRFGDFSLDADSGELRRNGTVARLQPQPLQVLLAMLRRRGQIVAREELQASLWPENTNVEFDDGPNHAIRRLRSALGDTAQVPCYIETIPGADAGSSPQLKRLPPNSWNRKLSRRLRRQNLVRLG